MDKDNPLYELWLYGVLGHLRQRLDLDEDDASKDHVIASWSKEKMFDEYCNWHGLIHWGPQLRSAMDFINRYKPEE